MKKAAIYARKSTADRREKEEKSTTRQVENARAFAEKNGWSVAEAHVFKGRWDLRRGVREAPRPPASLTSRA